MFKIQENADGSTSVYHKKTGQHMCTIPVKPNSSTPLRINVVEPQPSCNATVVVKDWRLSNFKAKVPDDTSTEDSSDDDLKSSGSSSCRVSSPAPSEVSEGPSDPAEAFARALDLAPRGQEPRPLRRLSRVEPNFPRIITELTPLSCALGSKLLKEDPRQILTGKAVVAAVRKYEGLCVASGLPESGACARLRCRRPAYPVCASSRTLKAESHHVYSFGRRQRRERLRVIETGLDKRGRQLLALCRPCEVRLEHLPKEEIRRWRRRRAAKSLPPVDPKKPLRPVCVRLPDITVCILRNSRDGHYYLAGTRLRIADYPEFLEARRRFKDPTIPLIDLTLDSPPKTGGNSRTIDRESPRLVQLQVGGKSLLVPQPTYDPARSILIHHPPTVVPSRRTPVLQAMRQEPTHFRCFACGCNRYISGAAETEVMDHMRRYHSVQAPDRFLTVYRDQVKQCTIVEAFPGFKGNND